MMKAIFIRLVLIASGAVAALIGAGIVFVPDVFYGSYQVLLPESASLRSELAGMGSFMLFGGGLMLAGAVKRSLESSALIVGVGFYGAFTLGRLLSFVVDGAPSSAILAAWTVEAGLLVLIVAAAVWARKHPNTAAVIVR